MNTKKPAAIYPVVYYKVLAGTYRTFSGYEFRPFSNGGRKFGAVVARKRNDK